MPGMMPGPGGMGAGPGRRKKRGRAIQRRRWHRQRATAVQAVSHGPALDFVHQAKAYLEYRDFKIQRQRAVPGPDPWTGPWKDVSTDSSIDVLMNEASDFDPEIVNLNYTNQVFTPRYRTVLTTTGTRSWSCIRKSRR